MDQQARSVGTVSRRQFLAASMTEIAVADMCLK